MENQPIQSAPVRNNPYRNLQNKVFIWTLAVAIPVALLSGMIGGYFFGQRTIVTENGETAFSQTVQIQEESATISAVEKVSPAVVSIIAESPRDALLGFESELHSGSGFILTSDGLIATNKHVVDDVSLAYTVILNNGQQLPATVVSADPSFDFAILKVQAQNLPIVELGSSDSLKVGERVIAIGNAAGQFENTVTVGVISALNRSIQASDGSFTNTVQLEGLLQTDAAINPGNSGGPLVNLNGQVIGVNTATDAGSENIGFAIPIDEAKVAIESVIETGEIVRPFLGVRYVNLTRELAELNELSVNQGAYITAPLDEAAIVPESPAETLGLKRDDIILKLNEEEITPERSLAAIMRKFRPGDTITVTWLSDGQELSAEVELDVF